jgi:hypothetical protein
LKLTQAEIEKIKEYAERFLEHKEGKSMKVGDKGDLYYDRLGFTGEYLVHKHFNKQFEWDFDKKQRFDDIVLFYGDRVVTCDVKSSVSATELRVPKWQIDEDRDRGIEIYILVDVYNDLDGGEIVGIISKTRFKKLAELKKYNSECYCMGSEYLSSIDELDG